MIVESLNHSLESSTHGFFGFSVTKAGEACLQSKPSPFLSLRTHYRQGSCDLRASAHICKQVYRYIISSKYSVCPTLSIRLTWSSLPRENVSTDSSCGTWKKLHLVSYNAWHNISCSGVTKNVCSSFIWYVDCIAAHLDSHTGLSFCEHMCGKPTRHLHFKPAEVRGKEKVISKGENVNKGTQYEHLRDSQRGKICSSFWL